MEQRASRCLCVCEWASKLIRLFYRAIGRERYLEQAEEDFVNQVLPEPKPEAKTE
jgi:hypothetical protein